MVLVQNKAPHVVAGRTDEHDVNPGDVRDLIGVCDANLSFSHRYLVKLQGKRARFYRPSVENQRRRRLLTGVSLYFSSILDLF